MKERELGYYDESLSIQEALSVYFLRYHFADGGYNDRYFRIKIGPLFIPFPNTQARLEGVKMHDIHHLLTGYTALWKGEVELAGWELASGCGRYYMAWFFNLGSFFIGLFTFPRALFRAFLQGRRVKSNLYNGYVYAQRLLQRTVGELRQELDVNSHAPVRFVDFVIFLSYSLIVLIPAIMLVALICISRG